MNRYFRKLTFWLLIITVFSGISCRKQVSETEANSFVDKVAISFGNDLSESSFTIINRGQQTLTWSLEENISWFSAVKTSGSLVGGGAETVTVTVDRAGLSQNQYDGLVTINTNNKIHTIEVYLTVNMFLITVINPVFTPISIEVDTTFGKSEGDLWKRKIGAGDSTQFGYFEKPDLFVFYAETQGIYGDTTKLGLKMEWDEVFVPGNEDVPRIFLNVSNEYFFLSILNIFETLSPLWVNAGTQYEMIENIVIYQRTFPLPLGYYRALQNTLIRAMILGGTSQVTWINGDQFEFLYTENQAIEIENYNSDSLKFAQMNGRMNSQKPKAGIKRDYGNVIDFFGKPGSVSRENGRVE
jgi:hypothetical protein